MPARSRTRRRGSGAVSAIDTVVQPRIMALQRVAPRSRLGGRRRDEIIAPASSAAPAGASIGIRQRTLRLPQERRKARLQARGLRRAGRGRRAGHRAGHDDPAGRKVRRPAGGRAAAAVPAHPVERDDGLVPAPEGAQRGRHELLRLRERGRRRRRFRHPRDAARCSASSLGTESACRLGLAGADLASSSRPRWLSCRHVNAKPSCCVTGRNSMSPRRPPHGLFGRKRQDALLAGGARLGKGSQGKGNRTMNATASIYAPRRPRGHRDRASRARIAARLNERRRELAADIGERLRFAREQALERRRGSHAAGAERRRVGVTARRRPGLSAARPGGQRIASVLPLVALVGGLVLIQHWQTRAQISVAAEVDAALLADDLPLNAYRDAGFVEFLKTPSARMRRPAMTPGLRRRAIGLRRPRLALAAAPRPSPSARRRPDQGARFLPHPFAARRPPRAEDGRALAGADGRRSARRWRRCSTNGRRIDATRKQKWLAARRPLSLACRRTSAPASRRG